MFIPKQQQPKLARSRHCRLPEATIMKLLHIDSSALGANSASRELSAAIVARWRADVPGMSVQYRDLASDPLPHLDGNGLAKADPARAAESDPAQQQCLDADAVGIGDGGESVGWGQRGDER